jgi:hypothetical protein
MPFKRPVIVAIDRVPKLITGDIGLDDAHRVARASENGSRFENIRCHAYRSAHDLASRCSGLKERMGSALGATGHYTEVHEVVEHVECGSRQ